jgi:NADPH2:quinone reductase
MLSGAKHLYPTERDSSVAEERSLRVTQLWTLLEPWFFRPAVVVICLASAYNNDDQPSYSSGVEYSGIIGAAMQAAFYERTGPALEVLSIDEMPTPVAGPGEVRVKVAWSGVNPSDVKSRAGLRSQSLPFPRIIPHSDGAGLIDQVGPDVASTRIGERVWIWNAAWMRPFGTAAQYVVLPSEQAVPLPQHTDLAVGACLGIPALTAYHAVTVDGGIAGKNVLVAGGAGAVGQYAIQLAKIKGAQRVIATVSGPEKAAAASEAGADITLNYRTDDLPAAIADVTGGQGIDRIVEVDLAANIHQDIALLRPDGEVIVYGSGAPEISVPFSPAIRKGVHLYFFIVYNLNDPVRRRAIDDLTALLEGNRLHHAIATRLPLSRIAEAHELVERGRVIGNVVLEVG